MSPRLNIDDEFWGDLRIQEAISIVLSMKYEGITSFKIARFFAHGALLDLYRLAQEFWCNTESFGSLIPENRCNSLPIEIFTQAGLVTKKDAEYYVHGSRDKFDWLIKRSESGKLGGLAKASKLKQSLAKPSKFCPLTLPLPLPLSQNTKDTTEYSSTKNSLKRNQKQGFAASGSEPADADSTALEPFLENHLESIQGAQNASGFVSISTEQIKPPKRPKIAREPKPLKEPKGPTEFYQVWEKYAFALADKWGVKLTPAPTALRHCKNLISAIGFENALAVAEFYPSRQKDWYVKHGHDLMWAVKDATLLLGEFQTGVKKTQKFVDTVHREEDKKEYESMREKGAYKNILLMTEEEIKEAFPNEIEESTEPILLTKGW